MKIAPVYLKTLIEEKSYESWSLVRREYFPPDYYSLYDAISRFVKNHREIPSPEQLRLSLRDPQTLQRLEMVLRGPSTECSCEELVEFLKDEYVQASILRKLTEYVRNSVAFETAQQSIEGLSQIAIDVEKKAQLTPRSEDMRYIELFEPRDVYDKRIKLGLNEEYDNQIQFAATDYILIGGRRGAGKSLTCSNIAHQVVKAGKSALYFTIEMESRAILQRAASIATGVPNARIRRMDLSPADLMCLAEWWSSRYEGGKKVFTEFSSRRIKEFSEMHRRLSEEHELVENKLDIVYDPGLTLSKIDSEVKKRSNLGVIIVDYVNQIKTTSKDGQYDWKAQIETSKFLKGLAQDCEVPVISPYQTDKTGEARFSKGILDSADAAFSLEAHEKKDACMTFTCEKMRNEEPRNFTSVVNWPTLKIGPESTLPPEERGAVDDSDSDL